MKEFILILEKYIKVKKFLYLKENEFELYSNVNLEKANIPKKMLNNKLVEVLAVNEIDSMKLFQISSNHFPLGWVKIKNAIEIYNNIDEEVAVEQQAFINPLNDYIGINTNTFKSEKLISRYFVEFEESFYEGIINESNDFLGFVKSESISRFVDYNTQFKFKNDTYIKIYNDKNLMIPVKMISKQLQRQFVTNSINIDKNALSFRIGKDEYYTKLSFTDIDLYSIDVHKINKEEQFIKHIISTIKNEKEIKEDNKLRPHSLVENNNSLSKENKELKKQLKDAERTVKEQKLEISRIESKKDYYNRLSENLQKKLDYYTLRNEELENRLNILEDRIEKQNKKYDTLANSRLGKAQLKKWAKNK